jgi:hypothetical protein
MTVVVSVQRQIRGRPNTPHFPNRARTRRAMNEINVAAIFFPIGETERDAPRIKIEYMQQGMTHADGTLVPRFLNEIVVTGMHTLAGLLYHSDLDWSGRLPKSLNVIFSYRSSVMFHNSLYRANRRTSAESAAGRTLIFPASMRCRTGHPGTRHPQYPQRARLRFRVDGKVQWLVATSRRCHCQATIPRPCRKASIRSFIAS